MSTSQQQLQSGAVAIVHVVVAHWHSCCWLDCCAFYCSGQQQLRDSCNQQRQQQHDDVIVGWCPASLLVVLSVLVLVAACWLSLAYGTYVSDIFMTCNTIQLWPSSHTQSAFWSCQLMHMSSVDPVQLKLD